MTHLVDIKESLRLHDVTNEDITYEIPVRDYLTPSDKMYHMTPERHREAITQQGIRLGSERSTVDGHIHGIYLAGDPHIAQGMHDLPRDSYIVAAVDVSGLDLYFDPEFYSDYSLYPPEEAARQIAAAYENNAEGLYVYVKQSIPPDRILGWGRMKSYKWIDI